MTNLWSFGRPPALTALAAALLLLTPASAQESSPQQPAPSDEVRIITLPEPGTPSAEPAKPAPKPAAAKTAKKPAPQDSNKPEVETFQAWTVRCIAVEEEGKKQRLCQASQSVFLNDERRTQLLEATLFYPPGSDKLAMLLYLPLGVLLPPGVEFQIDQGAPRNYPYARCEQAGCRVEVLVEADLLQALKAGQQAVVSILDAPRRKVGIPLSLQGLTAAISRLKS